MSLTSEPPLGDTASLARDWIAECKTFTTRSGFKLAYRRRGKGPVVVLLHGFPTWSYDYAVVARDLETDHDVITLDFLGFGASDKPTTDSYSVSESSNSVEDLLQLLKLSSCHLVVHDYGGIVGQELLDRHRSETLPFRITSVAYLNCGIVYSAYRPNIMQRILITPLIGGLLASIVTPGMVRSSMAGLWGKSPLSDEEFENIWYGIALKDGQKLSYLQIRYNTERAEHHERWEAALAAWKGPLHLIWGLDDPVSGKHVLDLAVKELPQAVVTKLDNVGHFVPSEAPEAVAKAIRESVAAGLSG